MMFRSDSQRRAVFSNMSLSNMLSNRFARKELSEERKADISGAINDEISRRTEYGNRNELVPKGHKTILTWSNGIGDWIVGTHTKGSLERQGNPPDIEMHANEIIVPFPAIEVVAVKDRLEPLPLGRHAHEVISELPGDKKLMATIEWAVLQDEANKKKQWQKDNV